MKSVILAQKFLILKLENRPHVMGMEKRDMRSLPRGAREEQQPQVINLSTRGWIYDEIAEEYTN
ncbi:MAG: hypothetical protein VB140_02095 [Burkholderia sp.]